MLADSTLSGPRVGYALGRGFGTAVQRNRLRRQLRELVKTREAAMAPGYYVFGASPRAKDADFAAIASSLDRLLAKCATDDTGQTSVSGSAS